MIRLSYVYLTLFSLIFCNDSKHMLEVSKINSHSLNSTNLNFRIGYKDTQNLSYGAQWWFSENYFISGDITPESQIDSNTIYHKISLGRMFKINNKYSSILEIGVHKQRFNYFGNSNWHEVTFSNKFSYKNMSFDFMLTKFDVNYDNNSIMSLSFTYILDNLYSINSIVSMDTLSELYHSINFNLNI